MKLSRAGLLIGLGVILLWSCTSEHSRETIKASPELSKQDSIHQSAVEAVSNESMQKGSVRRTIETSLSQDDWPSTDGNEVQIVYKDSITAEINVVIYGETKRTEFMFLLARGRVSSGIAKSIFYSGSIYETHGVKEDTCLYKFEFIRGSELNCVPTARTQSKNSVECMSCFQFTPILTELIHDVEVLTSRHSR